MAAPGYTFVSVSTAKPGRFDDLVALARGANEAMDGKIDGLIGRQTSADKDGNTVVVWSTFETKKDLYDWLSSEEGAASHGDESDMTDIIETFTMYELEPVSNNL